MSIHYLPAELIAEIFLIRIHEVRAYCRAYSQTLQWNDWYNFLFVCRRWNSVAMETPLLWNFVHTGSSMACIRTMLERSNGAALDVEASRPPSSGSNNMDWLHLVLGQSHRI